MDWGIRKEEFHGIGIPPSLTDDDLAQGFSGVSLFYGFGDDGSGHADSVLSGKMAWDYACKRKKGRVWQGLAESGRVLILVLLWYGEHKERDYQRRKEDFPKLVPQINIQIWQAG